MTEHTSDAAGPRGPAPGGKEAHVPLKPGLRLRSQACSTEVIVVRVPSSQVSLCCGGAPMVPFGAEMPARRQPAPGLGGGTLLGKRYTSPSDDSLEVLVTKAGAGQLTDGGTPLVVREAKPLPASD